MLLDRSHPEGRKEAEPTHQDGLTLFHHRKGSLKPDIKHNVEDGGIQKGCRNRSYKDQWP